MEKIITSLLIIVAIIHLIPVTGVLGEERLASLYGLSFEEPNIAILMRHRAILFGLLGMFIVYAAFNKALQPLAFATGFISVISFILIAWEVDSYNEENSADDQVISYTRWTGNYRLWPMAHFVQTTAPGI